VILILQNVKIFEIVIAESRVIFFQKSLSQTFGGKPN